MPIDPGDFDRRGYLVGVAFSGYGAWMDVHIRPALAKDTSAIFAIRTAVTENALTLAELACLGITPASVAQMIAATPCTWIAETKGIPVGFAMIDDDAACLFAAFVLPSHEGRGIGRALVAVCEAALFARHPSIWLETAAQSRAAGFYRKLGWGHEHPVGGGDLRLEKHRKTG